MASAPAERQPDPAWAAPDADAVCRAVHDAVQARLREARPSASFWPDLKLGLDCGIGYGFSGAMLGPFVIGIYRLLRADPALAGADFEVPAMLPVRLLLEDSVSNLERFVAADVCGQLRL